MQQGRRPRLPTARSASFTAPAAERDVLTPDAWDRMTVTSVPGAPARDGAVPAGLAGALALVDAGFAAPGAAAGRRAVPSAGAIHPYECYVVAAEDAAPAVFYADAVRRRVYRLAAQDRTRRLLGEAGLAEPPDGGALVVVVTRPWLSMRKYGDRGYLYTHLDAGHLAANLLGTAADRGPVAELRLRLHRAPLAELLGIADRCREVHSVLRIGPADRPADPAGWAVHDLGTGPAATGAGPEAPSWLERMCWESLRPLLSDVPSPQPPSEQPFLTDRQEALAGGPDGPAGQWQRLTDERRSVKGFGPDFVPGTALRRALLATRTPLAVDLAGGPQVRITLAARAVTGMAPGVYRSVDGPVTAPAPGDADLTQACMQQEHLGNAAAVVLLHADRDELVGQPPSAMREALFRAGALGQLLYLGATAAGLGITGVGGFDAGLWRRLGCLPEHHELLYLVLLGVDSGPGVKWDRLQTAYPQRVR